MSLFEKFSSNEESESLPKSRLALRCLATLQRKGSSYNEIQELCEAAVLDGSKKALTIRFARFSGGANRKVNVARGFKRWFRHLVPSLNCCMFAHVCVKGLSQLNS